jgi:hypothetical protein
MLGLEGLEDRVVMSAAMLTAPTLAIQHGPVVIGHVVGVLPAATFNPGTGTLNVNVIQPNERVTFEIDKHDGELDVFLGRNLIEQVPVASVKGVAVNLASSDTVAVDDSNGFPFAAGTVVFFSGSGSNNSLVLEGSATINGGELYVVAGDTTTLSHLLLGGTNFEFVNAIGKVTDSVKITGTLQVSTAGQNVLLTGLKDGAQRLTNLGPGGGSTLTYSHKVAIDVEEFAASATVTLDARAPQGEASYKVVLHGAGDVAVIEATPAAMTTVTVAGDSSFVDLFAISAPVSIQGNGTTSVALGFINGTAGIRANVNVQGAKQLVVDDLGNHTTQENVHVTESTISGTGLFGSPLVQVHYSLVSGTGFLEFFTGHQADTYTVANSSAFASFNCLMRIVDDSNVGLNTQVILGANSDLNLTVSNPDNLPNNDLSVIPLDGGRFINPNPFPNLRAGTDFAVFGEVSSSQVNFQHLTRLTLNPEPIFHLPPLETTL